MPGCKSSPPDGPTADTTAAAADSVTSVTSVTAVTSGSGDVGDGGDGDYDGERWSVVDWCLLELKMLDFCYFTVPTRRSHKRYTFPQLSNFPLLDFV